LTDPLGGDSNPFIPRLIGGNLKQGVHMFYNTIKNKKGEESVVYKDASNKREGNQRAIRRWRLGAVVGLKATH